MRIWGHELREIKREVISRLHLSDLRVPSRRLIGLLVVYLKCRSVRQR